MQNQWYFDVVINVVINVSKMLVKCFKIALPNKHIYGKFIVSIIVTIQ